MTVGRLADGLLPQNPGDRDPRLALLREADDLAVLRPGKSTFELGRDAYALGLPSIL